MAKRQEYTLGRVFVGDRLLEDLSPEEQDAFRRRTVQRMGDSLNTYFSLHPEEYVRVVENHDARERARGAMDAQRVGA